VQKGHFQPEVKDGEQWMLVLVSTNKMTCQVSNASRRDRESVEADESGS